MLQKRKFEHSECFKLNALGYKTIRFEELFQEFTKKKTIFKFFFQVFETIFCTKLVLMCIITVASDVFN